MGVDKKGYERQGVLSLKGGKGFPVGRGVGILRWSYGNNDAAPISINCWPEDEGNGSILVNIEMELTRNGMVLHDVNILIPLGTQNPPNIDNGSLEFSVDGTNPEAFFPIQIGFRSETLLCPIIITGVTNSSSGAPIPNEMTKAFAPDRYHVA